MSAGEVRLGLQGEREVRAQEGCAKRKWGVVTGVALAAIAFIGVGSLSLLASYHLLPHVFAPLGQMPLVATGVFLGSGGILLTGLVVYSLQQCFAERKERSVIYEAPSGVKEASVEEDEKEKVPQVEVQGVSLLDAMERFQIYDPTLAKSYSGGGAIPSVGASREAVPIGGSVEEKTGQKITLLKALMEEYPEWKEAERFVTWVSYALLQLQDECQKSGQCERELSRLAPLSQALQIARPTPPSLPSVAGDSFEQLKVEKVERTPDVDYPGVKVATNAFQPSGEMGVAQPDAYPTFSKKKVDLPLMKKWHTYLFALYKEGSYLEKTEAEVAVFLLERVETTTFIRFLETLSNKEKIVLLNQYDELTRLLVTLHLALGRIVLHPSRMIATINTFGKMVLLVQRMKGTYFKKFTYRFYFDRLLRDNYLDLGPHQREICAAFEELSRMGKDWGHLGEEYYIQVKYCGKFPKLPQQPFVKPQEATDYREDFTGKHLPFPVVQLKGLSCLLQGIFTPHTMLSFGKPVYESRKEFPHYMDELRRALRKGGAKLFAERKLLSITTGKVLVSLGMKVESVEKVCDNPWERQLKKEIGIPFSPFYGTGFPIREVEMRNRIVEGTVANFTSPEADDDGNGEPSRTVKKDGGLRPGLDGLKQNPFMILQEKFCFPKLSLEASRDLQMMASGRDNRASNAIYTFAKYPHLLFHEEYGKDFRRIFRLLVFRKDLLLLEIESNPSSIPLLFGKTEELLGFYSKTNLDAWAFLFKFQIDFLQSLPEEKRIAFSAQHLKRKAQLEGWIKKAEKRENQDLYAVRLSLHLAFLYEKAIFGFGEDEVVKVCQSYIVSQAIIENLLLVNSQEGQFYYDLGVKLHQAVSKLVAKEGLTVLDSLLPSRVQSKGERKWTEMEKGVYVCDDLLLDLCSLKIVQNGQMEGSLPREIRESDSFIALLGNEVLQKIHTFTLVKTPLGKAWHVSIVTKTCDYALYFKDGDKRFPLVFRKQEEGEWEQWIEIREVSATVPNDFLEGFCWRNGESLVVETPSGKPVYQPIFEGVALSSLDRLTSADGRRVLDPGEEELFSRLDTPGSYVITRGNPGTQVDYLRGKIRYVWNGEERRWESPVFKGYFLSSRRVEKWQRPGTQGEKKPLFFAPHFDRYHILESPDGRGKLLLAPCEYERGAKSSYVLEPKLQALYQEGSSLVIFDLEKNGHLVSKNPLDSFYLSYLLYIQGKYGEALLYLDRSQAVWTAQEGVMATTRKRIKEWILNWGDDSPNGCAFLVHMLLQEHQLIEANFLEKDMVLVHDKKLLPPLFEQVVSYFKREEEIDPLLFLSPEQKEDLVGLVPRCPKLPVQRQPSWIPHDVWQCCQKANEDAALAWALEREIGIFEDKVKKIEKKKSPQMPKAFTPKPLLDLSSWLTPLEGSRGPYSEIFAQELQEVFSGETLADQMGQELARDILAHKEKVEAEMLLKKDADLQKLKSEVLAPYEKAMRQAEKRLCNQALQLFLPPPLPPGAAMERKLQSQEALFDHLFEKARFCFGLEDYSQLVEMGVIQKQQVGPLDQILLRYEIKRTDRQLITRKRESVEKLLASPDDQVILAECSAVLQVWRGYDPETHPFAHLLLLFEDELNLTARDSQLAHIRKLASHENAYIHEAMAGGKTTLLRNLFSAIQKRNGYLAGVVTYSPLMAMHHKEYASVNQLAMGSRAYPVLFNRNAPHDVTAIRLMTLYHLKALARQGLIDQTPQAALSLNHTLTELTLALKGVKDPNLLAKVAPQIAALQKLLKIRGSHLSVYSDEIDKIFDPSKDHNYAHGQAHVLGEEFYRPALLLTRLLMTKSSLSGLLEAIKGDHLQRMEEVEFEGWLRKIAEEAFDFDDLPFAKESTLDYLTEVHQKDSEKQAKVRTFYQEQILQHQKKEVVTAVQILHSYIGVLLRGMKNKRVGTDFGRSQDGIHVKPYSFSAVCQESSQRSFVLSTILETCLDYVVSGVSEEGVDAYIETVREQASFEIDENTPDLDSTATGKQFRKRFGVFLSKVTKKHHLVIQEKIESSYDIFEECLCEILLKKFTYHAEKMEGNAHLLSHLIHSFSGSSGSPERVKTLPGSIEKHKGLIRQEGAIGSVFYSLFLDFDPETDLLSIAPETPFAEQIVSHLKPGNTLIDSAPFFSGMRGEEIVEMLSSTCKNTLFRFLDEEDDIAIWEEGSVHKGEAGVDLAKVISIIPHKGRQGTNWKFTSGTEGIVSVGMHLDLTSFYQSLMRLRLLGKGQKGKIAYDAALEKSWEGVSTLEGKSLLTKIVWSLVQNEEKLLKRLHYQANRKEIRLVRACAMDQIKQEVTNVQDLALLQEMALFELVAKTPLDPTQCGAPIEMGDARTSLRKLLKNEKDKLETFKGQVGQHIELSQESKDKILRILNTNLSRLSATIFLEAVDLPESVAVNFSDIDATEEIEIELDQAMQQEGQIEQELSLEVEVEIEAELTDEVEIDDIQEHPHHCKGMEHPEQSLVYVDWWKQFFSQHEKSYWTNNTLDQKRFPEVYLTNHGLGIYKGDLDACTPEGEKARKELVWCFGEVEAQAPLSSKILVIIKDGKQIACQMGSTKDADFFFAEPLDEMRIAHEWKDIAFAKAIKQDLSSFPSEEQRKRICPPKKPTYPKRDYYNQAHQRYVYLQQHFQVYKFDLQETEIPEGLPTALHKVWKEKIALAKFLYVAAKFSKEELAFLSTWLKTSGFTRQELAERLTKYLEKFFPSTKSHPLLTLLAAP
ncbi:MAG: hypothetical protein K940chlam9_01207 [Chlamydiae bacterium]|nr:hypothetical protein [Chlamydiota bacterium]